MSIKYRHKRATKLNSEWWDKLYTPASVEALANLMSADMVAEIDSEIGIRGVLRAIARRIRRKKHKRVAVNEPCHAISVTDTRINHCGLKSCVIALDGAATILVHGSRKKHKKLVAIRQRLLLSDPNFFTELSKIVQ